jgi:hypothetical protein
VGRSKDRVGAIYARVSMPQKSNIRVITDAPDLRGFPMTNKIGAIMGMWAIILLSVSAQAAGSMGGGTSSGGMGSGSSSGGMGGGASAGGSNGGGAHGSMGGSSAGGMGASSGGGSGVNGGSGNGKSDSGRPLSIIPADSVPQ